LIFTLSIKEPQNERINKTTIAFSGGGATDFFRGIGARKNATKTKQSGHAPRSGPEVKNGRSSVQDGAPERLFSAHCSVISLHFAPKFAKHKKKFTIVPK